MFHLFIEKDLKSKKEEKEIENCFTNIILHSSDDGSLDPKRYNVSFATW